MTFKITQAKPAMKQLSEAPTIDQSAVVVDCEFGVWTEIGARTSIRESVVGDYSYVVNDSEIIYSDIGKFVNIAAHTRINPGQHPMDRASMHHSSTGRVPMSLAMMIRRFLTGAAKSR